MGALHAADSTPKLRDYISGLRTVVLSPVVIVLMNSVQVSSGTTETCTPPEWRAL